MGSAEFLQQFEDTYVLPKSLEKINLLDAYYEEHKDFLKIGFIKSLADICSKITDMQRLDIKADIGYIIYTLYRTNIIEENYTYTIEAFSKNLYHDYSECTVQYDAKWLFDFLHQLKTDLQKEAKRYMNKVLLLDVQKIILKELEKYNEYMVKLARYSISEATGISEYDEICKDQVVEIGIGEYKTKFELIYREDSRKKESKEIKEWLQKKLEDGYTHHTLKDLDLSNGSYEALNLGYGIFNSDFRNSNMRRCMLAHTNFHESNLEGVNFEKADLSYCYLKEASLGNTNFKWANLEGAIFSKDQQITLSEGQRKTIIFE